MRQLLQSGERDPVQRIPTLQQREAKVHKGRFSWYYSLRSVAKP